MKTRIGSTYLWTTLVMQFSQVVPNRRSYFLSHSLCLTLVYVITSLKQAKGKIVQNNSILGVLWCLRYYATMRQYFQTPQSQTPGSIHTHTHTHTHTLDGLKSYMSNFKFQLSVLCNIISMFIVLYEIVSEHCEDKSFSSR